MLVSHEKNQKTLVAVKDAFTRLTFCGMYIAINVDM